MDKMNVKDWGLSENMTASKIRSAQNKARKRGLGAYTKATGRLLTREEWDSLKVRKTRSDKKGE